MIMIEGSRRIGGERERLEGEERVQSASLRMPGKAQNGKLCFKRYA